MRATSFARLALAAALLAPATAQAQFSAPSYLLSELFENVNVNQHAFTMAKNGLGYWVGDGGGSDGERLFYYDLSGSSVANYSPGLDFRSVFSNAAGDLFARSYADNVIYKMGAPGVFAAYVTLVGGTLNPQSNVVLDDVGSEYISMSEGLVSRWDLAGNFLGSTSLVGFGGVEAGYPQDRGIVSVGGKWLSYDGFGGLSMWDASTGVRLGVATLLGAGSSFDARFSLSYTGGKVWIVDASGAEYYWRGFDIGFVDPPVSAVPEPASLALMATGLLGIAFVGRPKKKHPVA